MAEERRARRYALLRDLYDRSDGSTQRIVYGVGSDIGITDEQELLDLTRRLEYDGMLEFKTTGFGLSITRAGVEAIEASFPPDSPERRRVDERKRDSIVFLRAAYDATDGSDTTSFNFRDLGTKLGWDDERTSRAIESLVDDFLIEHWTLGGNMRMTMEGIKYVEEDE